MAVIALSILIIIYDLCDENVQQSYEDISFKIHSKNIYGKMTKISAATKQKYGTKIQSTVHNYIDVNKASYKQIDNNRDM